MHAKRKTAIQAPLKICDHLIKNLRHIPSKSFANDATHNVKLVTQNGIKPLKRF